MPKKMLGFAVAAVVVLAIGLAAMVLLKKQEPTEVEIRAAVVSALPKDATIDQMSYAVFPADRASGRVSVKGTYSFSHDIFSPPKPPLILMKSLSHAQIYDRDLSDWWVENSGYYPQFKGRLGEFQKIYSSGAGLNFSGELPYMAIVDGTRVDNASLVFKPLDGTSDPKFGYAPDDANVKELSTAIVAWRDRRRDEAAASAKAAQAAAEAAAMAQAAVDAAAAKAAAVPQYASPFYPELGQLQPIILAPGQTSEEINAYDGMPLCWTTVPGLIRESKNEKGEWHDGVESNAFAYRFTNPKTSKESLTVNPWRKSGSSCS